ncbi:uncharacterized protein LOC119591610 [Penaeus monodon]|uniref:uncharacterized protein LOC119591610 n=1 Tax=Penaeus monodon TaxID=6687 RepID=UPI0018A73A8C|nr:uncharacterized protein LOC119591610 [Penaeus monodon]
MPALALNGRTISSYKTLVGTVRTNKKKMPHPLRDKEEEELGSSASNYTKEMRLYVTSRTKRKLVPQLSQHTQPNIAASDKPEITKLSNATKRGIDTFDQMCAVNSCSRKTRHWPLCAVYGMLNAACIISYIISSENVVRGGAIPTEKHIHAAVG